MNIVVFDTETTNLDKPFAYNIGYAIYNTDTAEILTKRDFIVEQVWHNMMLFVTAYYADKRDLYIKRLKGRSCIMDKFGYITQAMYRDFKEYGVEHGFAYNSPFDAKVFNWCCDWFKCINPFDTVQIHDIRGQVHRKIAFTDEFQRFCNDNELYTESGNYSTTAETVYRYITNNLDFDEEHTALADSLIELDILRYCVGETGDWTADYKVYASIPRVARRLYTVQDAEGVTHKFPYTQKRKIVNGDGVVLKLKE